jgi:hypothetical protein
MFLTISLVSTALISLTKGNDTYYLWSMMNRNEKKLFQKLVNSDDYYRSTVQVYRARDDNYFIERRKK